ncbi:hypothetical protein [Pseudomonas lundensis]|uniref:hypothetical protein n=1 Tax=Pseudomonas lundensis TaxID=86185 RepID=UPI0014748BFF|nr:hypothetical protein [Pseudomonas lundensis]NNA39230.1 hypothetical protein [Pseudomonas lundensis]
MSSSDLIDLIRRATSKAHSSGAPWGIFSVSGLLVAIPLGSIKASLALEIFHP